MNRALLIGTSSCPEDNENFPDLPAVPNDLSGLQDVLTHPSTGIFQDVKTVCDVQNIVIAERVEEFCKTTTRDDLGLIYFSGHGKIDEYNNLYLAASNTKLDVYRSRSFSIDLLRVLLTTCLSQKVVIVLDCCHSGVAGATLAKSNEIEALKGDHTWNGPVCVDELGSWVILD